MTQSQSTGTCSPPEGLAGAFEQTSSGQSEALNPTSLLETFSLERTKNWVHTQRNKALWAKHCIVQRVGNLNQVQNDFLPFF